MPALRQASMSSVPAGAVSFFPSTVKVTSAIIPFVLRVYCKRWVRLHHRQLRHAFLCERARLAVQVIFKLVAKLLYERDSRHGRRVAQRAEGAAQHVFRQVLDVVDVFFSAEAGVKARERLLQPVRTFAAGNAP